MKGNNFSLKNVIKHDYITNTSLACVIIMGVFLLEMYFIGYIFSKRDGLILVPPENRLFYYWAFCGMGLIGLLCFVCRTNTIKSYFNSGIEVKGVITELGHGLRSSGRIIFKYNIEWKEYHKTVSIHTTKITSVLKKDDEITVLVRPEKHSKAIIKDIFVA